MTVMPHHLHAKTWRRHRLPAPQGHPSNWMLALAVACTVLLILVVRRWA
jgi:hypothetical protein